MLSRHEGESVDAFAARRARDRELVISGAPGGEAERPAALDEEAHEMLGLSLLVCLLERMTKARAARLVAYLGHRYARRCEACGAVSDA